jgi:hypothetical protein
LGLAGNFTSLVLGASPIADFKGQTEKTGHFLQPTAIAIGQSVMAIPNEKM